DSARSLVTTTGGLDLFPPGAAIRPDEYLHSLDEVGVEHELLDERDAMRRWPQLRLPEGTLVVHQADAGIVPAALGTATMQQQARRHGALLRDRTPVTGLRETARGVEVEMPGGTVRAGRVVVCADAWTNDVLAPLDVRV